MGDGGEGVGEDGSNSAVTGYKAVVKTVLIYSIES